MKRKVANLFVFISLAVLLGSIPIVSAQPRFYAWTNPSGREIYLPYNAFRIVPGIFSLGYSLASNGKLVYFADINPEGAISATIVWDTFSGPSFNIKLASLADLYGSG